MRFPGRLQSAWLSPFVSVPPSACPGSVAASEDAGHWPSESHVGSCTHPDKTPAPSTSGPCFSPLRLPGCAQAREWVQPKHVLGRVAKAGPRNKGSLADSWLPLKGPGQGRGELLAPAGGGNWASQTLPGCWAAWTRSQHSPGAHARPRGAGRGCAGPFSAALPTTGKGPSCLGHSVPQPEGPPGRAFQRADTQVVLFGQTPGREAVLPNSGQGLPDTGVLGLLTKEATTSGPRAGVCSFRDAPGEPSAPDQ